MKWSLLRFKYLRWYLWLILAFLVTRIVNLNLWPIFTDEAIYIRWSQIGSADPNNLFISLSDGKQPWFTWVTMIFLKMLPGMDPLILGRLSSVVSGGAALLGIYKLSQILFPRRKTAYISSWLYIILPFTLLYDRLALYDSWVSALYIWCLYWAVRLARKNDLKLTVILGLFMGMGLLNKSSAFFSYPASVLAVLFNNSHKPGIRPYLKYFMHLGLAITLSLGIYSCLRISPLFYMIGLKNNVFLYSMSEWLSHPFIFLRGNFLGMWDWVVSYLTWPLVVTMLCGLLVSVKYYRSVVYIVLNWLIPFLSLAVFAKVLYPRFILFMVVPLLIIAAQAITWINDRYGRKLFGAVFLILIFTKPLITDYFIIFMPDYAPIPWSDRSQLIADWPAGGGIRESVALLKQKAADRKITVYTEGTFGLLPYALEIYLKDNKNISIKGIWPLPKSPSAEIMADLSTGPVYLLLNESQQFPSTDWTASLIAEYPKGLRKNRHLRVFRMELREKADNDLIRVYL